MFLHRSLRQKKTCLQGQDKWLRKLRHPCKHRCHTHCCAPLTPLSLRLVLAVAFQLVLFCQAFTQSSPAAPFAPKPSKVSLTLNMLNWGQPPLIVRLACGSRGRRSVTVFACYVTFFLLPPLFRGVAAFASFVPQFAQQPHIINPKESLPSLITFRYAHSATLH